MCGLFAGLGKLNSGRMIALGSMNEERGTDSVGLAYLNNGVMQIAKVAERPCVALNVTLRKQVTEAAVSGMFIGHTRQATQGEVTARNAHPFFEDGIAFAHNGIIINDNDFGTYAVDSESLIHGIKDRDFSKYEGAIALVWIQDGKLKAYRCGNPLYRGRINGTLYLASDSDYLKAAGCTGVKELSEGMIYTFHTPLQVTTERVKKNKTFTYSSKGYGASKASYMTGYGWEDQLAKNGTHSLIPHSAAERQSQWWNEEKKKDEEALKQEQALDALEEMKEDFRTPSDIVKERVTGLEGVCECCGEYDDLNGTAPYGGMCLDCITWMDSNGVNDRDIPRMKTILKIR